MTKTAFKKVLLMTTIVGAMGSVSAQAADFTFKDKAAFEGAVKEYIMANPVVIMESMDLYRVQQEQEAKVSAAEKLKEHTAYLTAEGSPAIGNPDADITVVEFFDYNCGYCKRALPDIQAAVKDDKNLRVVFKDMSILGPSSRTAALWSLAAHNQDKYFDYHVALMDHKGPKEEGELMKLATKVGLDAEKLKADANSEEIAARLEKDMHIAREVGAQGTPAFIIGSQFVGGYVGEEGLKAIIAEERAKLTQEN